MRGPRGAQGAQRRPRAHYRAETFHYSAHEACSVSCSTFLLVLPRALTAAAAATLLHCHQHMHYTHSRHPILFGHRNNVSTDIFWRTPPSCDASPDTNPDLTCASFWVLWTHLAASDALCFSFRLMTRQKRGPPRDEDSVRTPKVSMCDSALFSRHQAPGHRPPSL